MPKIIPQFKVYVKDGRDAFILVSGCSVAMK